MIVKVLYVVAMSVFFKYLFIFPFIIEMAK